MGRRRRRGRAAVKPGGGNGAPAALSQQTEAAAEEEKEDPSPPPSQGLRRPEDAAPALKRRLLGLIRGFYLDAISRLPTADLRATLARGLLVGGHCCGPLHPAHNVIANSVWYAAAFPLHPPVEVDVLGTQAADRAARRSLDGLLACLLRICPSLSPAAALWQLSRARADLRVAVASACCAKPSLLRAAEPEVVSAAFHVAAEAARHPNPAAFAFFASSVLPGVERDVSGLLAGNGVLSRLDIDRLSSLLLPYPLPDEILLSSSRLPRLDPSPRVSKIISGKTRNATRWHEYVLGMARAALCKFNHQTGLHYELHTIYGESLLDDELHNQHFHINFVAQPKEDHTSSSGHRLFFFAEAPRPGPEGFQEEGISTCCLVEPSPGDIIDNCDACLMNKRKINHPTVEPAYHTRVLHFGGQFYGISTFDLDWNFRPNLCVDYLYFDPDRDNGLVERLHDLFVRIDAFCSNQNDD